MESKVLGNEVEGPLQKQVGDHELTKVNFMGEDLIERILLRWPISSCVRVAALSKRWYSVISSSAFSLSSIAGAYPFLFLWGLHPGTLQTSSCMYDPLAGRWFTLTLTNNNMWPLAAPSDTYSLTSTPLGTLILYPACNPSSDNVLLRFAPNPTNTLWSTSSAASKPFNSSPIVAAFDSGSIPPSSSASFEVFVLDKLRSLPTIQVYNSASDSWEVCKSLNASEGGCQFMDAFQVSSAVLGRKVYLANISLGTIACFSMDDKIWSPPSKLQAEDARCFLISSTNRGLYALGLCAVSDAEECVKLFRVEEACECKEVSKMPHHLWSLLTAQFEQDTNSVLAFSFFRCVGGGNLIYVYNGCCFSKIRVCVCDINAGYSWYGIPALPDALQHVDVGAECCSLQLLPHSLLQSCNEQ